MYRNELNEKCMVCGPIVTENDYYIAEEAEG
jgi:hypothetical protein